MRKLTISTDIKDNVDHVPLELPSVTQKVSEVFSQFKAFTDTYTSLGFVDSHDISRMAATHLYETGRASTGKSLPAALILYSVTEMPPSEREFVASIHRAGVPVVALLPKAADDTLSALATISKFLNEDLRLPFLSPSIDLFGSTHSLKCKLEIFGAADKEREIIEVIRSIIKRAADGVGYRDMAVVLVQPNDYRQTILDIFSTYNIPFYFPGGRKLSESPAGKAMSILMALRQPVSTLDNIIALVTELPWHRFADDAHTWPCLLRQVKQHNNTRSEIDCNTVLYELKGQKTTHLSGKASLCQLLDSIIDMMKDLPARAPWSSYSGTLLAFIQQNFSNAVGLNELGDMLTQLVSLEVIDKEVSWSDYRSTVLHQLTIASLTMGTLATPAVAILPYSSTLGLQFNSVFMPGLSEGSVPVSPGRDPLLNRGDIEQLTSSGLPFAPKDFEGESARENLRIRSCIDMATQFLLMTYPMTDVTNGKEQAPSPFLVEAAHIMGYGDCRPGTQGDSWRWRVSKLSEWCPDDKESCSLPNDFNAWALLQGLGHEYLLSVLPQLSMPLTSIKSRQGRSLSRYDGVLGQDTFPLLEKYRLVDNSVSPSDLETFFRCPFQWFLQRVLSLPMDEDEFDYFAMPSHIRGTLVHKTMAESWDRMTRDSLLPLDVTDYKTALTIINEELAKAVSAAIAEKLINDSLMLDIEIRDITRWLSSFLEDECSSGSPVATSYQELHFGRGEGPSVSIVTPSGGNVHLHGKVDRLDIYNNNCVRILDYKTGQAPKGEGVLRGGQALQLPVYIMAGIAFLQQQGITPESIWAEYVYLPSGKRTRVTLDDLPNGSETISEVVKVVDDSILKGLFPQSTNSYGTDCRPDGSERENCRTCGYRHVCDPSSVLAVRRKADDPLRQIFESVRTLA